MNGWSIDIDKCGHIDIEVSTQPSYEINFIVILLWYTFFNFIILLSFVIMITIV